MLYGLLATTAGTQRRYAARVAHRFGKFCSQTLFQRIVIIFYTAVSMQDACPVILVKVTRRAAVHIAVIIHQHIITFVTVT